MNRLKELRTDRKLLQKDVADFLGVERTTYVKYESGVSEPSINTLTRLAEYFGVSVDYILGQSETKKSPSVSDEDIKVALFGGEKDVPDEVWDEVKRFAQYAKERYGKK